MKVLVTGATGTIGRKLVPVLEPDHELTLLSRGEQADPRYRRVDITDVHKVIDAAAGMDAVVHLAIATGQEADHESHEFNLLRVDTNVKGTYNVFEAARQAGVKRVVFASTGSVAGGYATDEPYSAILTGDYDRVPRQWRRIQHDDPVRPNGMYAASKAAGEAIGRCFTELHGLSIICLRLGRVEPKDQPLNAGHMVVFLAHRDCIQLIDCAVEAPDHVRFDIFFGTSANKWGIRDLEHAREVIGYRPEFQLNDWPLSPGS